MAARPYGATYVEAASAGRAAQRNNGERVVPLTARILYGPRNGNRVREARVRCRLDASGRVVELR